MAAPTLRVERELLRTRATALAAMDEVGRGALAGPVTVGVVVVDIRTPAAPAGVRDSKLMTPQARERAAPEIRAWACASAVGSADASEIDELGIIGALRRAGQRALAELSLEPDLVLLDGRHDWLTAPPVQDELFAAPAAAGPPVPPVVTRVKADLTCSAVAAASVLAKVHRDAVMARAALDYPHYAWDLNKGYSSPEHAEALRAHGPCELHRRSWSLPG